jgi:hypothetical protein
VGLCYSKTQILAKSGRIRRNFTKIVSSQTDAQYPFNLESNGIWNNTIDNIISIGLSIASGTFTGKIKLYKMVNSDGIPVKIKNMNPYDKKIKIPILIEEKNITEAIASTTFSDLDGNVDGEYFIEYETVFTAGSSNGGAYLRPNNITTGYNSTSTRWWGTNGDDALYTNRFGLSLHGVEGSVITEYGTINFNPKTGVQRLVNGKSTSYGPNETMHTLSGGSLSDTTTNITSLVFGYFEGTFIGTVKLYKIVDSDKIPVLRADDDVKPKGTFRIPQLIEEKNITETITSTTFEGLNGDLDEEYLLESDIYMNPASGEHDIVVNINGNSDNQGYIRSWWGSSGGGSSGSGLAFGNDIGGGGGHIKSKITLNAKTGIKRKFFAETQQDADTGSIFNVGYLGRWNDTTTNITSLTIQHVAGGNGFIGKIRLYKMVDLVIG